MEANKVHESMSTDVLFLFFMGCVGTLFFPLVRPRLGNELAAGQETEHAVEFRRGRSGSYDNHASASHR